MEFVDLKAQYNLLRQSIDRRMAAVLEHCRFIMGPEVQELEAALARYTGSSHCIGCASGTDALLIALMALGVGAGDEVITSPFTFIANAEMIALLGARPVFVDIDPETYNLDSQLLRAAITPKTKAIMPIALYGQCADMDAIGQIAGAIPVIEDAAQSFGAIYKDRRSCNLSVIGCTSFFPSKPLACYGDGGACFTSDAALAEKMRRIRDHGQQGRYQHTTLGLNSRLDTLQAAVLLAKLECFDTELKSRTRIANRYTELLRGHVAIPYIDPCCTSVYAQYTVQLEQRDQMQARLRERGVPSAVHYPLPIHLQPVFAGLGLARGSFPLSEAAAERVLSLPMHPYLTDEQLAHVAESLKAALAECRN